MKKSSLTHQQDIAYLPGSSLPLKRRPLILAVEDDRDNLLLLYHLAKIFGYDILLASEGQTGLDMVRTASPDLILLDIALPNFSGFDVLDHLRLIPHAPIIAVTGMVGRKEKQKLLQAGCSDHLSKPYLIDELQTIIFRHLPLLLNTALPHSA